MTDEQMSFDKEKRLFLERSGDQRGKFKALILLGTGQPTTAALLISVFQPEHVAFLLTERTRTGTFVERVASLVNCSSDTWLVPEENYESADEVYLGLRYVLDQWRASWPVFEPKTIAADVTGGFATMSVGLAKAAHVLGLTTVYVRSEYADVGGRYQVVRGSQWLEFPPDPYKVFGDLEAAEARHLYVDHDYEGAQRIFADLAERVPEPEKSRYATYAALARGYAAWDVFNWYETKDALADVLNSLNSCDVLHTERPRLEAQYAMVQQLAADNADLTRKETLLPVLRDMDRVLPLLGTLYANALRRADQGRYDMAAMFLYRCLELMSQHRLAVWGLRTEEPDYRPLRRRIPDIDARYQRVEEVLFDNTRGIPHWKRGITLFNGYMLLTALDDPLVQGYDITRFRERIAARNTSMLAHGFRLIEEQEYSLFREVVDEMLPRFFRVCNRDQDAWERDCTFLPLFQQEHNQ